MTHSPVGPRAVALPPRLGPALARGIASFLVADAVAVVAITLAFAASIAMGHVVIAHGVAILGIAILANAVHELGHVAVYRLLSPHGRALLECEIFSARLHRAPLPGTHDRLVTAAGPLAPLVVASGSFPFAAVMPAEVVAAAALGVAHAASLVLPTADRAAWRAAAGSPTERGTPELGE